jgi:hypothetical protein
MRKAFLALFAITLMAGGVYVLGRSLDHPNFYSIVRGAGMAVIFIAMGGYLVWDDFLKQHFRRRKS